MSFHEIRLPTDISFGSAGGPQFSTNIISTQNGAEQRNVNWSEARARYSIIHAVKDATKIKELIEFFRARQGRAYAFRFKDWADFAATAQEIGTGNDTEKEFQLSKSYTSGDISISRAIKKPVTDSVKIYMDSVIQQSGWSVDLISGMITFAVAPQDGAIITADYEFDVPVRFGSDYLQSDLDTHGISSIREITLLEVRV